MAAGTMSWLATIALIVYALAVYFLYKKLNITMMALSVGVGALLYGVDLSLELSTAAALLVILLFVYIKPKEGFNTRTPAPEISEALRKVKSQYSFSPTIEGYEDVKKAKDEVQAPASDTLTKKEEIMAMPFKLGEIPSQVKNGPHIDAASTLVKAINSLNPEQINAMSKDTQQLIDTQKSLMSMLGNMKPMLNDGKDLMNTFHQMFGQ
jgi:hypothetical protein